MSATDALTTLDTALRDGRTLAARFALYLCTQANRASDPLTAREAAVTLCNVRGHLTDPALQSAFDSVVTEFAPHLCRPDSDPQYPLASEV
jgi:hypothetical protein